MKILVRNCPWLKRSQMTTIFGIYSMQCNKQTLPDPLSIRIFFECFPFSFSRCTSVGTSESPFSLPYFCVTLYLSLSLEEPIAFVRSNMEPTVLRTRTTNREQDEQNKKNIEGKKTRLHFLLQFLCCCDGWNAFFSSLFIVDNGCNTKQQICIDDWCHVGIAYTLSIDCDAWTISCFSFFFFIILSFPFCVYNVSCSEHRRRPWAKASAGINLRNSAQWCQSCVVLQFHSYSVSSQFFLLFIFCKHSAPECVNVGLPNRK